MKLIDDRTAKEICSGDIVTDFRGDKFRLRNFTYRNDTSSGRVGLDNLDGSFAGEYYPSVINAAIVLDEVPPIEPTSPAIDALRVRANKFIDSEVNFRMLSDLDHGRKHLELVLMQFATNEALQVATELRGHLNGAMGVQA